MYRVNAERSQEKNDRIRRTQRCTKVTLHDAHAKKSSHHITIHAHLRSDSAAVATHAFRTSASTRRRSHCAPRIFGKVLAIYNGRRFCSDALLGKKASASLKGATPSESASGSASMAGSKDVVIIAGCRTPIG